MSKNAVSNSSCLIALDRIGQLKLLQHSFNNVTIPPAVKREFGRKISWLPVVQVKNRAVTASLITQIGEGESEAIALTMEIEDSILVLDDKKARRIAKQLGLEVIGTVGLILQAKKKGMLAEVKPLLNELQKSEFRISKELYREALRLAKENII